MEIKKCMLTKNRCYQQARKMTPKGLMLHSTGAVNKNLKRYVQPDDGILGRNANRNDWNNSKTDVCVHGFIGADKNGKARAYQTLPFNYRCWGCGQGSKGSYNSSHIQIEWCEGAATDKAYYQESRKVAVELFAQLCKQYGIPASAIVSHAEAHRRGYASNHADCDSYMKNFGDSMDKFRADVNKLLTSGGISTSKPAAAKPDNGYLVQITADLLNVRKGAGVQYPIVTTIKKGGVYTIVGQKNGWGQLKSGAGWINLKYTKVKK